MKSPAVVLMVLVIASTSTAASRLVMRDGSGDYTNLQDAIDASAPGDTVLVGPGRFGSFHVFLARGTATDVVLGVTTDSLAIIGLDRDQVIIGPADTDGMAKEQGRHLSEFRCALMTSYDLKWLHVENITFENCKGGVYADGPGIFRNCRFAHIGDTALYVRGSTGTIIEDCEATDVGSGIHVYAVGTDPAPSIVRNCAISDSGEGIRCSLAELTGCTTIRCYVGISASTSRISDCNLFDSGASGIYISGTTRTTVTGCLVKGSGYSDIHVDGELAGSRNVLYGGTLYGTIRIADGSVDFHDNHIFRSDTHSVFIHYHNHPGVIMDVSDNYWGTTDMDSLAAWIWDGTDDIAVPVVTYLPILTEPITTLGVSGHESDNGRPDSIPGRNRIVVSPNPFNPSTGIAYTLSRPGVVKLVIYDLVGRRVRQLVNEPQPAGTRTVVWDGRDASGLAVSSGSYFVRLSGERVDEVQRMTLVR